VFTEYPNYVSPCEILGHETPLIYIYIYINISTYLHAYSCLRFNADNTEEEEGNKIVQTSHHKTITLLSDLLQKYNIKVFLLFVLSCVGVAKFIYYNLFFGTKMKHELKYSTTSLTVQVTNNISIKENQEVRVNMK
jgi:hypothetical protein